MGINLLLYGYRIDGLYMNIPNLIGNYIVVYG